jgi:hypothetical protein
MASAKRWAMFIRIAQDSMIFLAGSAARSPPWLPVLAALRLQQVLAELSWQADDGD